MGGKVRHLDSHLLGTMMRRLSADWEQASGHPIYFAETFVDPELAKVDPFDYLTQLQCHQARARTAPQDWMPWNYRATLDSIASRPGPPA